MTYLDTSEPDEFQQWEKTAAGRRWREWWQAMPIHEGWLR